MRRLLPVLAVAAAATAVGISAAQPPTFPPHPTITWKKTVLDTQFRSEGVAIADVNKDGKIDVLTGEWWFEAPDWKPHAIRKAPEDYTKGDQNVYSQSFCCWVEDLNGDGWPDLIVISFPGAPCYWYENPKGKPGHWTVLSITAKANNYDFPGELVSYAEEPATNFPMEIEGTSSRLSISRPASLPKGQSRPLPTLVYLPRKQNGRVYSLRTELRGSRGGSAVECPA